MTRLVEVQLIAGVVSRRRAARPVRDEAGRSRRCWRLVAAPSVALLLLLAPAGLAAQEAAPQIDIEKATNGEDADKPPGPTVSEGGAITWTYVVTNNGSEMLQNVAVSDDRLGAISCPATTLAPGASMSCTATGTAALGQYANVGVVAGQTATGAEVGDSDPSHYFGQASGAAIDIEKATNGQDADGPPGPALGIGDTVSWTYRVTNVGSATLDGVAVSDDQGVMVSCPGSSLAPGASMTCTATGTVQAGQYANLGTVFGTLSDSNFSVTASDPSHYEGVPATPAIDLEKATNGNDADTAPGPVLLPGDAVTWTYVVTNTGNVRLDGIGVSDDPLGTISCPTDALDPGASMTCSATGTVGDGQYSNLGTVVGFFGRGDQQVSDQDPSHYYGEQPAAISLEKATNGEDADGPPGPSLTPGDAVSWSYLVTNTGQEDLMDVGVVDDQGVAVSCPQTTLAAGQSMTCSAGGTAVAGQYRNQGTASGRTAGGLDVTANDSSHYFGGEPRRCFDDMTATGTGMVEVCFTGGGPGCSFQSGQAVAVSMVAPPPPGITFAHGLVEFTTVNCEPGSTLEFTATFPLSPPLGDSYYKFGPETEDPGWYTLPSVITGNVVVFSITDGGLGDHDLVADGGISDPGGPGGAAMVPVLPPPALAALALLLALLALSALRRRRA